ncbi:MAG: histidinol dehydrogenase [Bacteroidales bacterium]|nr:histidinol dehydrogenase [Bacteroidales bacterium]
MTLTEYPAREEWGRLCRRPQNTGEDITATVRMILDTVRSKGDAAVQEFSARYGGGKPAPLLINEEEIAGSVKSVPEELKDAIATAATNIEKFHKAGGTISLRTVTTEGVSCWKKALPIEKAGLYIPGGTAPLFSTFLMLGIPAKLAGCGEIVVCTPPGKDGTILPAILYTAWLLGIRKMYRAGGAQAIAAMAYGTETIPAVYKIFGPGNSYVTRAKELVQTEGVAIDMPAGPSEVLVIADGNADPEFVAADLLSQAEHGSDSQVMLLGTERQHLGRILDETRRQLEFLPRKETAARALSNSRCILLPTIGDCIAFSNMYAPEHLILNCKDYEVLADKVTNAGSVFLGKYSCESAGDYASGTNHTLPTNGYARSYSGLSVSSFMKEISFQELSGDGLRRLGPVIERMAAAEMLDAHRNAVSIRLKKLDENRD